MDLMQGHKVVNPPPKKKKHEHSNNLGFEMSISLKILKLVKLYFNFFRFFQSILKLNEILIQFFKTNRVLIPKKNRSCI